MINLALQCVVPQLLEEDPALKKFKSYKSSVKQVSKIGNVLTMLVIAGMVYYHEVLQFFFPPFMLFVILLLKNDVTIVSW